jgi:hypothetical protein
MYPNKTTSRRDEPITKVLGKSTVETNLLLNDQPPAGRLPTKAIAEVFGKRLQLPIVVPPYSAVFPDVTSLPYRTTPKGTAVRRIPSQMGLKNRLSLKFRIAIMSHTTNAALNKAMLIS